MLATIIRTISTLIYPHPDVPENIQRSGSFGKLKIALLSDYFTAACLAEECSVRLLSPGNFREILLQWRPDLIFVESAFHGVKEEWRYKLSRQPIYLSFFPSNEIKNIVALARENKIPAIFWNKDDGAFFNAFIDVAKNFPYVFTTDSSCITRYNRTLPPDSTAHLLPMAYQPAFHNFTGFHFQVKGACFVGSYYKKIFGGRRRFLDMMFDSCAEAGVPMHIFDRNSGRLSHFFEFRFPDKTGLLIHPGVPYPNTANLYKTYLVSLNVNSIVTSPTMYSRRLLEIMACGGICVTNRNMCVEKEFSEYCHIVTSMEEALELFHRLSNGPTSADLERARAGAEHVARHHTWRHRLELLEDVVSF